jgi:GNAT superfamily N-acetyltransferase
MWRPSGPEDDAAIVRLCLALNAEDPGSAPVPAAHTLRTLQALRERPHLGRVVVLDLAGPCGYALLIPFWSNEYGGETLVIDELYVEPAQRGHGHATALIQELATRADPKDSHLVALALETTPANASARRLYERLGFKAGNLVLRRRLKP